MLEARIFPDRLKTVIVYILYKKGDKENIQYYGPISLSPSSKIL
jgi:hypothetical protein